MTLKINGTAGRKPVKMDIDLVPCFVFDKNEWPTGGYRQNPVTNKVQINLFCLMVFNELIFSLHFLLYPKSRKVLQVS